MSDPFPAECNKVTCFLLGTMWSPPSLRRESQASDPFPAERNKVTCFLTNMARKTGIRKIHQKPMLSLLVQHLQGPVAHILGIHAAPQHLPLSAGIY